MKLFVLAGILYIKKILTVRFSFLTYTFNFLPKLKRSTLYCLSVWNDVKDLFSCVTESKPCLFPKASAKV